MNSTIIRRTLVLAALSAFAGAAGAASLAVDQAVSDNTAILAPQLATQAQLRAGNFYAIATPQEQTPAIVTVSGKTSMQMLQDTIIAPSRSGLTQQMATGAPENLVIKVLTLRGNKLVSDKELFLSAQANQIAQTSAMTQQGYLQSVSVQKKADGTEETVFTPGVIESGLVAGVNWRQIPGGSKIAYVAVSITQLQSLASFDSDGKTVQLPSQANREAFVQVPLGKTPSEIVRWTDNAPQGKASLFGESQPSMTHTVVLMGTIGSFANFDPSSLADSK